MKQQINVTFNSLVNFQCCWITWWLYFLGKKPQRWNGLNCPLIQQLLSAADIPDIMKTLMNMARSKNCMSLFLWRSQFSGGNKLINWKCRIQCDGWKSNQVWTEKSKVPRSYTCKHINFLKEKSETFQAMRKNSGKINTVYKDKIFRQQNHHTCICKNHSEGSRIGELEPV